ncbi:transcriptional regulator EpsA [Rhodoferax lacus]|uniref:Transcriptional regulator EpsA n=1 Tax=Rhodoferax lacus TaxID=2184758 RepID=A0A3E1RF29_9BURK|nr:XrtB/PEP-CTERM-associated transcriptional regulator EpsA [Rhodoferax lacus]RFO97985.1 transcriptional regulator EpsA [Rhodoferax lacus]
MLKLTRDASPLRLEDYGSFSDLIHEVLGVRRHIDLMHWLQGGLQRYIPHDILIAAWGDFRLGVIHYDVVSALSGVRSESVMAESISPLLIGLFNRWVAQDRRPFSLNVGHDGFAWEGVASSGPIAEAMAEMKSSLVHGIGDQRGRHDCLYVFFSQYPKRRSHEANAIKILLPYIDAALRQVDLMPNQYQANKEIQAAVAAEPEGSDNEVLSEREAEIMKWVAMGKTNGEIGSILNVSSFTIKNHMQRIFKKLDVFNRAQAVSNFKSSYTAGGATRSAKQDA